MLRQCRLAFNQFMAAGVSFRPAGRDPELQLSRPWGEQVEAIIARLSTTGESKRKSVAGFAFRKRPTAEDPFSPQIAGPLIVLKRVSPHCRRSSALVHCDVHRSIKRVAAMEGRAWQTVAISKAMHVAC